jgi:DNA-binding CsgD family transcriptional regulator
MAMQSGLIKDMCQPLFEKSGINNFVYIEIDENGDYLYLNSSSCYYEQINNHELLDVFPGKLINKYFCLGNHLSILREGFIKELFDGELDNINSFFNMENFLFKTNVIKRNNESFIQMVRFGGDAKNNLLNNYYLNSPDNLSKFISNFTCRMQKYLENTDRLTVNVSNKSDLLQRIKKINQSMESNYDEQSIFVKFSSEKPYEKSVMVEVAPKEQLIISLTLKGMTAKDIGRELHFSSKTIEKYFSILKEKFECKSKLHLLGRLHEAGVLKVIYL